MLTTVLLNNVHFLLLKNLESQTAFEYHSRQSAVFIRLVMAI